MWYRGELSRSCRSNKTTSHLQPLSPQIPMPRCDAFTSPGMFERLMLQPLRAHAEASPRHEQGAAIRRHEVGPALAPEHEPMQPQPSIEGVDHSLAPSGELAPSRLSYS